MSKKILAPSVTQRDDKGRKFMDIVGAAYDKAKLTEGEAQRVNDTPGLADLIGNFIAKNRSGFVLPKGGRVHVVRVPVKPDRDWQEAINAAAAGPDTLSYNVRKVGGQYPPRSGAVKEVEIILLNFGPNGGSWDRAIAWAEQYKLKRTSPRHLFAVGEHKPQIHHELGFDCMYIVATEECAFEGDQCACYVWWYESERQCGLRWIDRFGDSHGWFAFLRE